MEGNILEIKHVSKAFPGVKALRDVSLTVKKGKVSVLIGENGAGKSTLIKIINGMYIADEGEVVFDGRKVEAHTPRHMMDLGVATIHQELSPVPELSIAENIFLGREEMFIRWKELYQKAGELIQSLGFHYDPRAKMRTLSTSGMQIIDIIKAVSRNAKVRHHGDEPTSSITQAEWTCLFAQIRKLRQGDRIVYITPRSTRSWRSAPRPPSSGGGRVVGKAQCEVLTRTSHAKMVGRELKDVYPPA